MLPKEKWSMGKEFRNEMGGNYSIGNSTTSWSRVYNNSPRPTHYGQLAIANSLRPTHHGQLNAGQLAIANSLQDNSLKDKRYTNIKEIVE